MKNKFYTFASLFMLSTLLVTPKTYAGKHKKIKEIDALTFMNGVIDLYQRQGKGLTSERIEYMRARAMHKMAKQAEKKEQKRQKKEQKKQKHAAEIETTEIPKKEWKESKHDRWREFYNAPWKRDAYRREIGRLRGLAG